MSLLFFQKSTRRQGGRSNRAVVHKNLRSPSNRFPLPYHLTERLQLKQTRALSLWGRTRPSVVPPRLSRLPFGILLNQNIPPVLRRDDSQPHSAWSMGWVAHALRPRGLDNGSQPVKTTGSVGTVRLTTPGTILRRRMCGFLTLSRSLDHRFDGYSSLSPSFLIGQFYISEPCPCQGATCRVSMTRQVARES